MLSIYQIQSKVFIFIQTESLSFSNVVIQPKKSQSPWLWQAWKETTFILKYCINDKGIHCIKQYLNLIHWTHFSIP